MIGFSGNAKYVLLGVALLGLTSTSAFSQQVPDGVTITRTAVTSIMHDMDSYVATLVSKCDKCDASTKSGAPRALSTLHKALDDLAKATNKGYADLVKVCK